MKKITLLLVIMFVATIAANLYAQNTFFPTKAGMVQVYELKNAKGKTEGFMRQTIKEVETSGSNMTISYIAENLDKNRKSQSNPPMEIAYKVMVKDGMVILDMSQLFANMQTDPMIQMEFSGIPMELPGDMQPGHSIKDAEVTMTMDMVFTKMKTTMKMTEGKCLAIEEVTVPAGTFNCHKITQTVTTNVMNQTIVSRTVSWLAPGVGSVKVETFDEKNQLTNTNELVELK
jgi:hypothetical protein